MSEQRIAEVFVELADTLVDDFDVVDFLHSLTERCVELLAVDAAGIMLSNETGRLQLVAGTSSLTRDLELFELQVDQGPCVDTFTSGRPSSEADLAAASARWPDFAPAAVAAGVRSTTALPMRLRGDVFGALNLFSAALGPLRPQVQELGQAMADIATIGLLNERSLPERTRLSEQLQATRHNRVVVEQAKGVLAAQASISVDAAFGRLRSHARATGTTLTAVALAVVARELDLSAVAPRPPRD